MAEFTKDELAKIKAKEAGWKAEGDKKVKAADEAMIQKVKSKLGFGEDFEPKMTSHGDVDFVDTSAVRSPVSGTGQDVRSLNMGSKSKTPKPSDMMKKGGKVKKMADGGEAGGLEEAIRLERMGVTPRMLREQTASNELQDLLPSGKKIGAVLRSKLDPETAAEMAIPQMAIARRIAGAAKDAQMPRSYADASGMKKGGKVKSSSASKRADGCCIRGKTRA